jgi:hypothetical protein
MWFERGGGWGSIVQPCWQTKSYVFFDCRQSDNFYVISRLERLDQLIDQTVRRRGAGSDTDAAFAVQPCQVECQGIVYKVTRDAEFLADLAQSI